MKPAPDLSLLLTRARELKDITQTELAQKTGIDRKRLSDFECHRGVPNREEVKALGRVLGLPLRRLSLASESIGPGCARTRIEFKPRHRNALIRRDRPSETRFWAAKNEWPELVERLEKRLYAREDAPAVRVYLRDARFDSKLEYLAHLLMLDAGAVPDRLAPQIAGFRTLPVVDPDNGTLTGHMNYPALTLAGSVLFPQPTLATQAGRRRVDLLWGESRRRWRVIEIDGAGHDSTFDYIRDEALKIPVLRFAQAEICSGSFLRALRSEAA